MARAKEVADAGHLWIYAGFVHAVTGQPVAGDLVDVLMPNGRFYARGFYNPMSKIRIRILHSLMTRYGCRSGTDASPKPCGFASGS